MWPEALLHRAPVHDFPPRWAQACGDDRYGLWADLQVGAVVQRLRWIEPGSFLMGSSAGERQGIEEKHLREWADANEAPAHPVTLTQGFWLADTPCTQALWLAVTGGQNPSEFQQGEEALLRPVEQVSWDDTRGFLDALHALRSEAEPFLPSEAQWEYACRAGTGTAFWWGDRADASRANMDGKLASTTPVKRYAANPWGLHDMHGNVWEWCSDAKRVYAEGPQTDPGGGAEGDARAVRGGSWFSRAVFARAAYRGLGPRGYRDRYQGFRLALRSPSPAGGAGARQGR